MKFKRLSILFVLVLALNTFFSSFAFADETTKQKLVALGDSITFGYKLEPNQTQASPNAFPSLIGGGSFDVTNLGVPGLTSTQLLAALNDPRVSAAIQVAKVITLDIGNNDLLQAAGLSDIVATHTPPDPAVLLPKVQAATLQLAQNMQDIVTKTKQLNPTSPIILYNLYNPIGESSTDPFFAALHTIGDQIITGVNASVIATFSSVPGVYIADAFSAFNGHQSQYIFGLPVDLVHPNLEGHKALAALADTILKTLPPKDFTLDLSASPTESTDGPVTITVSSTAENITAMKWLEGEKTIADFDNAGTDVKDSKFEVGKNGKYTVYVKDGNGKEKVQVIDISNITPPAPKEFTIDLTPSTTDSTEGPVNITVSTTAEKVLAMKWLAGEKSVEDFATTGTDINDSKFEVTENGKYTVYVKDGYEKEKVLVIEISNISPPAPEDFNIELTAPTTEPSDGPVTITISTTAEKVIAMKWLAGEKTIKDFANAGTDITDNQFEVSENGKYTVYIKDGNGKEKVQVIEISNITPTDPSDGNQGDNNGSDNPSKGDSGDHTPTPTSSESGNTLPDTATPMYDYLTIGLALVLAGLGTMKVQQYRRRRENI